MGGSEQPVLPVSRSALDFGLPAHFVLVGHLDVRANGLVLLTNDGDFAHNLAHPGSKARRGTSTGRELS